MTLPTSPNPQNGRTSVPASADYTPFVHLTVPNAALYRQVMRAFLAAKERFAVHLRPEDVHAAMEAGSRPVDVEPVVKALDSLVGWGNLRADPDTPRVTRSRTSTGSGTSTSSRGPARRPRRRWGRTTRCWDGAGSSRRSRCTTSSRSCGRCW